MATTQMIDKINSEIFPKANNLNEVFELIRGMFSDEEEQSTATNYAFETFQDWKEEQEKTKEGYKID